MNEHTAKLIDQQIVAMLAADASGEPRAIVCAQVSKGPAWVASCERECEICGAAVWLSDRVAKHINPSDVISCLDCLKGGSDGA